MSTNPFGIEFPDLPAPQWRELVREIGRKQELIRLLDDLEVEASLFEDVNMPPEVQAYCEAWCGAYTMHDIVLLPTGGHYYVCRNCDNANWEV